MCGIAGIITHNGSAPNKQSLNAMKQALAHRGPDGSGNYLANGVGFVHTRLAIIDLETGDQPFESANKTALIANGEVYNFIELRAALQDVEHQTGSDCEPPLHLYSREGDQFAENLRGMYAIAIHDPQENKVLLSRDPFGIKPLYYAETDQGLMFASEPQAILATGAVKPVVNQSSRNQLLELQFTTGSETIFQGIHRVLPGETVVIRDGRIEKRLRRQALPVGGPEKTSEAEALAIVDKALRDSVLMHQRSDVPYGMFLSGGIDSTAILTLMAELNDTPVKAFTVGFPDTGVHDEREHARNVAKALGAEHIEVEFTEKDFWGLLPKVAASLDDPVADYAILPTFKLAEIASKELKVILSGEGGDELFGGYGRYRSAMRPRLLGGRPMRRKSVFHGIDIFRRDSLGWRNGIALAEIEQKKTNRSRLQQAQAVDCADWLPNDLLIKLDRCLMANSIEGRTPFLDPEVAQAVFRFGDKLKVRDGMGKWILRKWLAEKLPMSQPFSKKRGFTVPVAHWIAEKGKTLGPLVAKQPGIEEICPPDKIITLFKGLESKRGFAAWVILFYSLWHNKHILGKNASGDVFETLAE
ncbi:MAG: asparagine synthase (glutamine-hydrolyzing) [Rhodospirillales bacterium]|nr:asparagine synthase (glutamine-hydrolyzing) [Rhodospirillales bacterium]